MNKKGFTLVELIAVISIIAILAILVLPNFINSYKKSSNTAILIEENQIKEAAKLLIEDYCRHPIDKNTDLCKTNTYNTSDSNNRYVCLKTLEENKYIDPISIKGNKCNGFVIFDKSYKDYKTFIKCADAHVTNGIEEFKDVSENSLLEICSGNISPVIDIDNQNTEPEITVAKNYYNSNTRSFYENLKEAFDQVESNQTIVVLENTTEPEIIELSSSKTNVSLDINGKKISLNKSYAIKNNGQLDIYNSNANEGIIENPLHETIVNNGKLTINKTNSNNKVTINNLFSTASGLAIDNKSTGEVEVYNNTYVYSQTGYGIKNEGSVKVYNGDIYGREAGITSSNGNIIVTGGIVEGLFKGIINSQNSSLTITQTSIPVQIKTSGSSSAAERSAIYNYGICKINGGTYTGYRHGVVNLSPGNLTIDGSYTKITGSYNTGIKNSGTAKVENVDVYGYSYGIDNLSTGIIEVDGEASYFFARSAGIRNAGTATLKLGKIYSMNDGILVLEGGIFNLGINDSSVSTTSIDIKGTGAMNTTGNGLNINEGATFNFYDGYILYEGYNGKVIEGNVSNVPSGYKIFEEEFETRRHRAYLVQE